MHLVLDPRTGDFSVSSAGHPPPVQQQMGSGRWQVLQTTPEPVLGLLAGGRYAGVTGRLQRGDALVVYADDVVEDRGRDLSYGVDRLTAAGAARASRLRRCRGGRVVAPRDSGDDDRTAW